MKKPALNQHRQRGKGLAQLGEPNGNNQKRLAD
jgi:hypothetical protein